MAFPSSPTMWVFFAYSGPTGVGAYRPAMAEEGDAARAASWYFSANVVGWGIEASLRHPGNRNLRRGRDRERSNCGLLRLGRSSGLDEPFEVRRSGGHLLLRIDPANAQSGTRNRRGDHSKRKQISLSRAGSCSHGDACPSRTRRRCANGTRAPARLRTGAPGARGNAKLAASAARRRGRRGGRGAQAWVERRGPCSTPRDARQAARLRPSSR